LRGLLIYLFLSYYNKKINRIPHPDVSSLYYLFGVQSQRPAGRFDEQTH